MYKKMECQKCKHYIPHYIFRNGKFIVLESGHCVRKINNLANGICAKFEKREDEIEANSKSIIIKLLYEINKNFTIINKKLK